MQQEVDAAFSELQSVFAETATIQGIDIGVTQGPNVQLSRGYNDGGTNQIQAVSLWYSMRSGPAPVFDGAVLFRGLNYRIDTIQQHAATWEISAIQIDAQTGR